MFRITEVVGGEVGVRTMGKPTGYLPGQTREPNYSNPMQVIASENCVHRNTSVRCPYPPTIYKMQVVQITLV